MEEKFVIENKGVCAPKGFMAAHTAAAIKYQGREDMAMIFSETDANVAGTFTTNVVKAAPVLWDRKIVTEKGTARAVVINSGIANACTGEEGFSICRETAEAAAKELSAVKGQKDASGKELSDQDVLVASTGVIGMQLPMDRITKGVETLSKSLSGEEEAGHGAAKAIMTTDTIPKEVSLSISMGGVEVTMGGMAKGSGMIHPNMCTMLSFITTDCKISQAMLQKALSAVVEDTYNMISVDGDTSTNDTCVVMANGVAGNPEISDENSPEYKLFLEALMAVNKALAMKMAGDGEGATALFEVQVQNARTKKEAKILAKSVICSNLTKAAIFGHDANWGRILCALGYAGVDFDPEKVDLTIVSSAGTLKLVEDGVALPYSEEEAGEILSKEKVSCICDMKQGSEEATAWGCDLTYDYVKINADYRS